MPPTAKPVMALYTHHRGFWSAFVQKSDPDLHRQPPGERHDLLLVILKCDLAMVCLTTFGVTVVIFHFNSRLCSTGSSSTANTHHILEFIQPNKEHAMLRFKAVTQLVPFTRNCKYSASFKVPEIIFNISSQIQSR